MRYPRHLIYDLCRMKSHGVGFRAGWVLLVLLVIGCSRLKLMAMTPEERAKSLRTACSADDNKTWDLGIGTADEIRARARGFYRFRPEGWVEPESYFGREDAARGRGLYDQYNHRKKLALQSAKLPDGLQLKTVRVDDLHLYEIGPEVSEKPTVLVVSQDFENLVFVASGIGKCPTLRASNSCEADALHTKVEVTGEVPCLGGIRLEEAAVSLTARTNNQAITGKVVAGDPLVVPASAFGLDLRPNPHRVQQPLTVTVGLGPLPEQIVRVDDVSGATPEVIHQMLRAGGLEPSVMDALAALPHGARAKEFLASLGPLRVEGARKEIEKARTGKDVLYVLKRTALGRGLPNDDEVAALLVPLARSALGRFGNKDRNEANFRIALGISMWLATVGEYSQDDAVTFEEAFGDAVAEGKLSEQAQGDFLEWAPRSPYSAMLLKRLDAENAAAEKEAKARAREEEAREKKERAAEDAKCSAKCEHTCMGRQYADQALCRRGCRHYQCEENFCVGACEVDCSTFAKAGQPGCVSSCIRGRCQ